MSTEPGFMGRFTEERQSQKGLRHLDRAVMLMFASYLRPHRALLLLSMALMAIVALVNAAAPYLTKIAIDSHILAGDYHGLVWILLAYIGLYLVYWAASYWGRYLSTKVGQVVISDVRRDLFRHVLGLSQDFYEKYPTGNILSRLVSDVNSIAELVSYGLTGVVADILTLFAIVCVMVYMNLQLAAIAFLVIPLILGGTSVIGNLMRKASRDVRQKLASLTAGVEENVAGARAVRSMGKEGQSLERLQALSQENYAANVKAIVAVALFFPFMSASGTLSSALVLWFGGVMVQRGTITAGVLLAFLTYVTKFFMPLREISQLFATYQTAAASAERMYELRRMEPAIRESKNPTHLIQPARGLVEFSRVSFEYEPGKPVLSDLSLKIEPAEIVAIVGRSGAGKTTLVKLLARLYDVNSGSVSLDGVDVKDLPLQELRGAISVVPQDVFLFDGTIEDNIRFAKPDASSEEVTAAARRVGADAFIEKMPERYATRVGERGGLLSGGQRQMVSLARAILADRPVLALDEATSSVDAAMEVRIQQAMTDLFRGRTVLMIAHRFSTLERASRIAVLDQGRIIGLGDHASLLQSNAVYRSLYEKQTIQSSRPKDAQ
ncbi:MAG: ABC transporter ATP-binding protein [Bacillota bacterium]|nr:ABC transporter ATP-binding protein [Bacillota bacterium]